VYAPHSRRIAESDLELFELAGVPQRQMRADATMPFAAMNVTSRPARARCGAEPRPIYCDRWRSSSSSAAAVNARMFATRSVSPVSRVITSSAIPAIAMQLWPALSP